MKNRLRNIWQETIRIKDISDDDSFFELGGDSLLAVQLICQIQKEFAIKLPMTFLFENPTLNEMCSYVQSIKREAK